MAAEPEAEAFGVFAENWQVFTVWADVWHAWRWVAAGLGAVREGLDWAQVESVLRLRRIKKREWPRIHAGLMVMQAAAKAELVSQQK